MSAPSTWKEFFGIDKLIKIKNMIKNHGGLSAFTKTRFLTDDNRDGKLVGEDQFGNRYYEDNTFYVPRNRYVIYSQKVWLNYDASQVPPEWHRWLHHMCQDPPTIKPLTKPAWQLQHQENLTLDLTKKYVPYSTTRVKIQGWEPGKKREQI